MGVLSGWPLDPLGGLGLRGCKALAFIEIGIGTPHPLTASVPTSVLPYNGPLLGGFNVSAKGLTTGVLSCRKR